MARAEMIFDIDDDSLIKRAFDDQGGIVQGIGQAVIRRCSVMRVSSLCIEIERPVQTVLPLVAQLEHV